MGESRKRPASVSTVFSSGRLRKLLRTESKSRITKCKQARQAKRRRIRGRRPPASPALRCASTPERTHPMDQRAPKRNHASSQAEVKPEEHSQGSARSSTLHYVGRGTRRRPASGAWWSMLVSLHPWQSAVRWLAAHLVAFGCGLWLPPLSCRGTLLRQHCR